MFRSSHSKVIQLLCAAAVTGAYMLGFAASPATAQTTLEQSKPRLTANALRVGSAPDAQEVTIAVYLKFRNTGELDSLIEDQQNPDSALYQKFLTPAEFHAKYSPLPADAAKVKAELARMGFKIVDAPAGGLYVTARGTVAQIKSSFHVSQELYSVHGKTVRSHAEAPTVPDSIAPLVLHIAGLDDSKKFVRSFATNHPVKASSVHGGPNSDPPTNGGNPQRSPCNVDYLNALAGTVTPAVYTTSATVDFTNCGYTPAQLQQAYGADKVTANGKGVRIGLADLYLPSTLQQDLSEYSKLFNLPAITYANFQEIYPPGLNTSQDNSCDSPDWAVESTLDVEAAHAIAPKADIVYLGDACNVNYAVPMQVLYQAIDNGLVDVISGSFGIPEPYVATAQEEADNLELKEAASLGITVMFSSGDSADYLQPDAFGDPGAEVAETSWPASSPWATAVGGTSLLLNKNGAGTKLEAGWGTYVNPTYDGVVWTGPFQLEALGWEGWFFDGGSGGGTSLYWSQPAYQKGVVPASISEHINTMQAATLNLGTPNRVVPDVAMLADPFTGFLQGETFYESTAGVLDPGCTAVATPAGTEYCLFPQGGTSVASPLFAGVIAVIDSARLSVGKPVLGFANPTLYKQKVGTPGASTPIQDVVKLSQPLALIDEELYAGGENSFAGVGINMDPKAPFDQNTGWIIGGDSKLNAGRGFDNVTGLGTPWLPGLVNALAPGAK